MLLQYIPENQTPDTLGRVIGYELTGVNLNGSAKIITLTWVKGLFVNNELDKIVSTQTESVNNSVFMREFNEVGEIQTYEKQAQKTDEDGELMFNEDNEPIMETVTAFKEVPAVSQWFDILVQRKKNIPIEQLIIGFIIEKDQI